MNKTILVLLLIISTSFPLFNNQPQAVQAQNQFEQLTIIGNFSAAASEFGFAGQGVENDPYIIENLQFNLGQNYILLHIEATTDYFIIRDSNFVGIEESLKSHLGVGIYLDDVENGLILQNTFTDLERGVILMSSQTQNNSVSQNSFTRVDVGVDLDRSKFNTVENNIISEGINGIRAGLYSSYNNISYNEIYNAHQFGVITSEVTENNYHGNIIKNSTIGAFNGRFANNNITDNKFEETGFTFLVTLMDDNDDYNATQMSGNTLDGYPITVQIGKTDLIFDNPMGQIIAVNSTNININADVTDIHTSRTSGVKISGKLASPLEISKIKITGSEDSSILNAKISELNISADKNNTITNVHVSSFLRIRSYNSSFTNLYTETLENAEFLGSNLTITDSKFDQIELRLLYDSKFSNNIINAGNVFPVGVMVASGSNNIISNNKVIAAQEYGIELQEDTSDNIITANEFISNPKLAQIKDDGTDNQIEKNSYDDWLHPDDNDDGFVDIPYKVIGTANNADPLPLTDNSHTLTTPSFISSPESSASGDITVSWSTAESNYNLTVYYSLYLIKDGKVHETIIDESKLTSVDVNLDDKTVGSEFKFRLNITAGNLDSTIETDLFTIADKPTSNTSSISTPTNEQSDGGFTIPFNTVVMIFVIIAISVVRKLSK